VFVVLIFGSAPLQAKEKVRVEVVDTGSYTYVAFGARTIPASPEQTITNCSGTSGIYARDYGYNCVSTASQATPEHKVLWPTALGKYEMAKVIMPNSAHLILICSISEKHCGRFVDEKVPGIDQNCEDLSRGIRGEVQIFCRYTMRGSGSLGLFQAEIEGDKVTISGPRGKLVYRMSGSWESTNTSPPGQDSGNLESPVSPSSAGTLGVTARNDTPIDPQAIADAIGGDAVAQYNLGYDFYLGKGVRQDYAQAAQWWRMAAEQGNPSAQNNLGLLYSEGQGVQQSYTQAVAWYSKAGQQGNAEAQRNLGILYTLGHGLSQDFQQAAVWYSKAAELGDAPAQCSLGVLYAFGQGVPQSYAEAYFWLNLSVAGIKEPDKEKCEKNRDDYASKLSPAELSRAQERTVKWFTEHQTNPLTK
jgi:hypothetical protein